MKHEILYQPSYSLALVQLGAGESVRAEAGAMVSMSGTIELNAQFNTGGGGLMGMLKRTVLGGESVFISTLTAKDGPGEVTLAPNMPGDIVAVDLSVPMLAERGSFLASGPGVDMDTKFGGLRGFMGGEGLFFLRFTGSGTLFLSSFGAIHRRSLASGERYVVDSSHIVAFDEGIRYEVKKAAKGWISSFTSGEGLVLEFTGPGTLYLQTRNPQNFASWLNPFLPRQSSD